MNVQLTSKNVALIDWMNFSFSCKKLPTRKQYVVSKTFNVERRKPKSTVLVETITFFTVMNEIVVRLKD